MNLNKLSRARRAAHRVVWGLALAASLGSAWAFPTKPIRLIVPVATGGLTDSLGRTLGLKLQQRLGQTVVVENKGGAGGGKASHFFARGFI